MSRKLFAILTLIISLLLTSCSLEDFDFLNIFFQSDAAIAKQTTEQLMSAIERHDTNGIKDVFAKTVVDNADDFDESVEELFDYCTGNINSYDIDDTPFSSGITSEERACEYICCSFPVVTDKMKYNFYFQTIVRDIENPDNVGIYSLYVIEQADDNSEPYTGDGMDTPGINLGKKSTFEDDFLNTAEEIRCIINDRDTEKLKSLFSYEALAEIDNFDRQAQKLFEFCENADSVKFKFEDHNVSLCSQNIKIFTGFDQFFLSSQIKLICKNKNVELYMEYCILDSSEPKNEGIITIRVADSKKHPDIDLAMDLKLSTECGIFVVE